MQFPKRVTIELTNKCNRACTGCPRHKMIYPQGYMAPELYKNIIAQLPRYTVIVPFFRGESTMHPYFATYMRLLKGFKEVQLATNADYLTPRNQKAILNNCTFISISLHEYKLPYQCKFLSFLKDAACRGLETQISIVENMLPKNRHKHFVKMWQRYVDRVRIYKEHSANGFGCMNLPVTIQACNKPFEDLIVYWDGKVGLCNHDWNNSESLGDLNVQSIRRVWRGLPYQTVRCLHENGLRNQVKVCESCSFQPNQIYGELIKVK